MNLISTDRESFTENSLQLFTVKSTALWHARVLFFLVKEPELIARMFKELKDYSH